MKNVLKIFAIFIFGMAGGIFADQIFWPYFVERPLLYQYGLDQPPIYVTEVREVVIRENTALKDAVSRVEKAVVGVRTQTRAGKILEGSGLVVTSDGLLVTLAELVPAGSAFTFFVDGDSFAFQVLRRDLENNLALVKFEGTSFTTVGFADFEQLGLGERVFLVGGAGVVNEGTVRAFDENSIQTNIFEEEQLSGSPLFNIEGGFLGLITVDRQGKVSATPIPKIRTFLGF